MECTSMTRFSPSSTSRSIREFRSFRVSCTVDAFDPRPSKSFRRPATEADWAASRVRSRAVSSMFDIRARDSIAGKEGERFVGASIVWCDVNVLSLATLRKYTYQGLYMYILGYLGLRT